MYECDSDNMFIMHEIQKYMCASATMISSLQHQQMEREHADSKGE